jgi:hypothetical protein
MAAAKKEPWKTGTSRRHITNLMQFILETLYIYGINLTMWLSHASICAKNTLPLCQPYFMNRLLVTTEHNTLNTNTGK